MKKVFLIEIHPTTLQKEKITQTIGICRYVYNLYLAKAKEYYQKEGKFLSGYDFSKWLNNVHTKQTDFWIKDVSSKAVKQAIMNGDKAFKNFFKGLSKFPRFKKKKKQDVKCYFPKNNPTDWTIERHRIKIPTLGWMRLKEYGYLPKSAVVKSGTVSYQAGKYFVSVLCDVEPSKTTFKLSEKGIGLDLGIKSFVITSNGTVYKNINKSLNVKTLEKKLLREQRSLSRKYESIKKGSGKTVTKRANINKNVLRVQKLHRKLASIRHEYIKSVVTDLVKTKPSYITIESLNIRGMMKNKHLSKAISKQCFNLFSNWLLTKCTEYGIELRQVSSFYPSSKKCSCCSNIKKVLKLSERTYLCEKCGYEEDRDINAAINLCQATEYKVLT